MDPNNPPLGVRPDGTLVYANDPDSGATASDGLGLPDAYVGPPAPTIDFNGYAGPQAWQPVPQAFGLPLGANRFTRYRAVAAQVVAAVAGVAALWWAVSRLIG